MFATMHGIGWSPEAITEEDAGGHFDESLKDFLGVLANNNKPLGKGGAKRTLGLFFTYHLPKSPLESNRNTHRDPVS